LLTAEARDRPLSRFSIGMNRAALNVRIAESRTSPKGRTETANNRKHYHEGQDNAAARNAFVTSITGLGYPVFFCSKDRQSKGKPGYPLSNPCSIFVASKARNTPKARLSGLTGSEWATLAPSGATRIDIDTTPTKAGR